MTLQRTTPWLVLSPLGLDRRTLIISVKGNCRYCDVQHKRGTYSQSQSLAEQQSASVPTDRRQRPRFLPRREVTIRLYPSLFAPPHTLSRLFSRFTISTTAQQHIRVSSATLENDNDEKGLSVFGTLSQTRDITVSSLEKRYHSYRSRFVRPSRLCALHISCFNLSLDMAEVRFAGCVVDVSD